MVTSTASKEKKTRRKRVDGKAMSPTDIKAKRNIGIAAHIDAGKTTVTERILFYSGVEHRMGEVHDGNAAMDWMDEERNRGITITAAATTVHWGEYLVNIVDTPGHVDFTAEVERSLRVLDGMVAVFDAVNGVEAQSETVWRQADRYHVPRIVFMNKMDRPGADFDAAVQSLKDRLDANPVPIQMPVFEGDEFAAHIDIIGRKALYYDQSSQGMKFERREIPEKYREKVELLREILVEQLSENVDWLAEKYIHEEPITEDDILPALREATIANKVAAVLCGAALKNIGIQPLMDAVCRLLPAPRDLPPAKGHQPNSDELIERRPTPQQPFSALAFKTAADGFGDLTFLRIYSGTLKSGSRVQNSTRDRKERISTLWRLHADERKQVKTAVAGDIVGTSGLKFTVTGDTLCDPDKPIIYEKMHFPETVVSMAIEPKSASDRDKLAEVLERLAREDPTFEQKVDPETGQTIICGMGELHLEVLKRRMLHDFNVDANVGKPRVSYRETVTTTADAWGEYDQVTGGKRQYAAVELRVEPEEGSTGISFDNELPEDALPKEFLPAVEEGIRSAAAVGPLGSYPTIGLHIALIGASVHDTDSTEVAFVAAASWAAQKAVEKASPCLLEPIMTLEVTVPEANVGDIVNDLHGRRAQIDEMTVRSGARVIHGRSPLSEMFGYATVIRSLSQGRATYSMEPGAYAPVPEQISKTIVA